MQEIVFLRQNAEKWKHFEGLLAPKARPNPDVLADLFIELTDDLSFARTHFPQSKTTAYLNDLTAQVHRTIYRNKKEDRGRFRTFWQTELPLLMYAHRKTWLAAALVFALAIVMGALSAAQDQTFVRLILGDAYVNMTLANIERGDPMAVYKSMNELDMFFAITFNNVRVAFLAFAFGIFTSLGTGWILLQNGIMLGSFQYFFYQKGLLLESMLTIWIHGTLEISVIVIAGCAGFVLGNSWLFPGTYPRTHALMRGAKQGLKIVIGLVPVFIIAGFLEGFVTRHTEMPMALSLFIILGSLTFIIGYFLVYPMILHRKQVPRHEASRH